MVTRIPPVPAPEVRTTASGTRAFALGVALVSGGLLLVACGDGSTVDNPDEAAPSTSATVAGKVETRDPSTTEATADEVTTTSADPAETSSATTTSTIVSTTTSQPGKILVLSTTPTTVRSTTTSTASAVTTSPPATVATTAPAVTTTTVAADAATDPAQTDSAAGAAADGSSASTGEGDAADDADGSGGGEASGGDSTSGTDSTSGADGDGDASDSGDEGSASADDSDSTGSTTTEDPPADTAETVDLPPLVPGVVARPACTPRPDSDGRIACTATLRNDLEAFTRISTSVAFFDDEGTQLSTENRFMNYVGPGEVFVQQFFGPASTARADVLASTPTAIAEPQVGEVRTTERAVYLPVDLESVQIGTLEPDTLGRQTSVVTVENSSGTAGTVTVKVAFYDADGVRVSNESRFVQGVEDGARVTRKFIGDPNAVNVRLLEVSVAPTQ